jgi:hypothetical protein
LAWKPLIHLWIKTALSKSASDVLTSAGGGSALVCFEQSIPPQFSTRVAMSSVEAKFSGCLMAVALSLMSALLGK